MTGLRIRKIIKENLVLNYKTMHVDSNTEIAQTINIMMHISELRESKYVKLISCFHCGIS